MPISVTINGSVTLDESAGLQIGGVAVPPEDNNDNDVALSDVQSGAAAFYDRLFGVGGVGLDPSSVDGAAHSAAGYITLTGSGGTVTSLGFTSSTGAALPVLGNGPGAATNMTAVNGGAISLFRDANGSNIAYGVDATGDIVFAMYLDPVAGLLSASVWMVQFEAISNPDTSNHDDALVMTGLGIGAGVTSEFSFAGLPSGQNLFGTVGNTSTAFVVFGKTPVLNPDGTFTNASNTINTSQGGGTTTIGVNNQMFDPGEGAYFTYVRNANPAYLANAVNGLDQNEADDADNIQYGDTDGATNDTIEVDSAFLRVSQTQGGTPASLSIAAFNITGSPQEEDLIAARGTGAVAVTLVRVYDSNNNLLDSSSAAAGANPNIGFSVLNGVYTVTGLQAGYKVEWFTSGNHDQVLISGVGGKFDIGGFGVNEPTTIFAPLTGVRFEDDGPSITSDATGAPSITDDESVLGTDNHANYAANFTASFGTDGMGATPKSYSLSTPGGNCGLVDTISGNPVFLFKVGDNIVGKAGADAAAALAGNAVVFIVSIDQTGEVTLDQQRAVVHDPNTGPDQSTTLSSAGLVVVNASAFDGDGDSASAGLNIGQLLNFKDDAPTITAQILSDTVNFVDGASVSHSLNGSVRADVNNATEQSLSGVFQYTIINFNEPHTVYANLDGVLSAGDTVLTYYTDGTHTTAVYRLTLDQTDGAAGSYTFEVLEPPPVVQVNFDFTDLPSGQNLFGIIAENKADLSKGGLLVMPNNPDINDPGDGQFTNTSGTVNTSKGGGPVTIGNGNQAFDHLNEGAFFCYVDNPLASAVGGLGLTQTSADDADTIEFNGTNAVTTASVEIVQASGGGTVKRPGPSLQIFAWDINPGLIDDPAESRSFLLDPTLGAVQSNIIGCKILDSAGNVVEYRTNDQLGVSNGGTLAGGTDAVVGIQFVLDFGSGTPGDLTDDVYSVLVSQLKAGYTIEFVTEDPHDLALVENRSGSYDIGGFNIKNNANLPQQDFDFQVQISDYDNDTFSSALSQFSVDVAGLVF